MEAGIVKVVFSSIINGTVDGALSANEAKRSDTDFVTDNNDSFKPEIRFSQVKAQPDEFKDKTSQEVFASLVNASNCANLHTEKVMDGYLTFTPEGAFLILTQ